MFKRNIILCVAAAFCVACIAYTGVRVSQKDDPAISSDTIVYNFGAKSTGSSVEHVFQLHNRGNSPLKILQVRTGCSCTTAEVSDKVLMPGSTSTVTAKLSLKNLRGPVEQDIVIECNDPRRQFLVLKLSGIVESAFEVHPATINFGKVAEGEAPECSVDIDANGNGTFKLQAVSCESPRFEISKDTIIEGKSYRIHVRMSKNMPKGVWQTKLRIQTDNTKESEIVIPVVARVQSKI